MTTNWTAISTRFRAIADSMRWASRISGVAHRLTKPDCHRCGGEDYVHSHTCKFALRGVASGSTRIAFGNAVERAAAKHATTVRGEEILAQLKVAVPDWRERA